VNGTELHGPILTLAIGLAAFLYSSVGHGGASAYLAVLALAGTSAAVMRPTALLLNVLVAGIGTVQFARAGHLRWPLVWPFLVTAIPMAYLGGRVSLPEAYYRPLIGFVLCVAAVRFVVTVRTADVPRSAPPRIAALGVGAALGLLAGLTGVGGGIFLSPLMLLLGWADLRTTAATSALFIVANSLAGLGGFIAAGGTLPDTAWSWLAAAGLGGLAGSTLGSTHFGRGALRILLAVVLGIAGLKLVSGG
jgi:uncharacterized membrane protein YfcA